MYVREGRERRRAPHRHLGERTVREYDVRRTFSSRAIRPRNASARPTARDIGGAELDVVAAATATVARDHLLSPRAFGFRVFRAVASIDGVPRQLSHESHRRVPRGRQISEYEPSPATRRVRVLLHGLQLGQIALRRRSIARQSCCGRRDEHLDAPSDSAARTFHMTNCRPANGRDGPDAVSATEAGRKALRIDDHSFVQRRLRHARGRAGGHVHPILFSQLATDAVG